MSANVWSLLLSWDLVNALISFSKIARSRSWWISFLHIGIPLSFANCANLCVEPGARSRITFRWSSFDSCIDVTCGPATGSSLRRKLQGPSSVSCIACNVPDSPSTPTDWVGVCFSIAACSDCPDRLWRDSCNDDSVEECLAGSTTATLEAVLSCESPSFLGSAKRANCSMWRPTCRLNWSGVTTKLFIGTKGPASFAWRVESHSSQKGHAKAAILSRGLSHCSISAGNWVAEKVRGWKPWTCRAKESLVKNGGL